MKVGGPLQYHPSLLEKARVPVICLTAKAARDGADNVSAGIQPAAASPGCENKKKKKVWVEANWSEPTVSTPPHPLILRAQNIGSHYVSPQWRLAPIHDFHHDILLGTLHNAQRQPSFYGDAAAPYTAKPTD